MIFIQLFSDNFYDNCLFDTLIVFLLYFHLCLYYFCLIRKREENVVRKNSANKIISLVYINNINKICCSNTIIVARICTHRNTTHVETQPWG